MSGHFSVLGLAVLGVTITTAHVLRFSIFSAFPPTLDEASQGRPLPSELPGGCTAEFAPSSDNGAPTGLFLFSILGTACLLVGWKAGRDAEQRKGQTAGHGSVALPPRAPGAVPALSCSGPPGCGLGLASGEHWHVTGGDRRGRRGQGEDGWAASALHHASPPPTPAPPASWRLSGCARPSCPTAPAPSAHLSQAVLPLSSPATGVPAAARLARCGRLTRHRYSHS